ncbi:hypothetical protein NVP1239O_01, partial [Vibrio phage 1.239.O._10N.261.52.F6]
TAGRPTKYKEEFAKQAEKICLLGATDDFLADYFEVDVSTINKWKLAHKEFYESIKRGKSDADLKVAESLYGRAVGYSHPEEKIFNNQGEIVRADTVKHYAPDPTAAIFWLKNRQPKQWRDKQDIDHSSSDGTMTPRLNLDDFYAADS